MRPRGVSASEVLRAATAAISAERRARVLCAQSGRVLARAQVAEIELLAAYEAAIARWEWWDAATGSGRLLGYDLRADGWPSLWSGDPIRDRLRDRARIGLGI